MDSFRRNEREVAAKILEEELGDFKLSELMYMMLALVPLPHRLGESPSFLFREIFLRKLSLKVQALITDRNRGPAAINKSSRQTLFTNVVMVNTIVSTPRLGRVKLAELCFNHAKFGKRTMKCRQLCSFWTPSSLNQVNSWACNYWTPWWLADMIKCSFASAIGAQDAGF